MDTSIICGIITGIVALLVCLLNNYFVLKKERIAYDDKVQKQLSEIERVSKEHSIQLVKATQDKMDAMEKQHQEQISIVANRVNDNMAEVTARLEEIIANQEVWHSSIKKDIEHFTYRLEELAKHVDAHNQVISRTYELEKRTELQEEKIKVANNRISDLERFQNGQSA